MQHVGNDARQLSANDFSQFQHLFRSTRSRFSESALRQTLRSTTQASSTPSNITENRNRSSAMSAILRNMPNIRHQNNDTNRSNRNSLPNIPRFERASPPSMTNGSNLNQNWQFLRVGNTAFSDLYRCAVASRNQQSSDASRQSDEIRLLRRIRRCWAGNTNNQGGR